MSQDTHNPSIGAPPLRAAILEEIIGQNWSQPFQTAVDELGLVMGAHLGLKRPRNEDRLAVARVLAPNAETYTVALVCDGVGSSESGDRAAELAISSIIYQLAIQQNRLSLEDLATVLVKRSDEHVRQELQGRGTTTLVMLLATSAGFMVCASVGDSRVYNWDPSGGKLRQVTIDDTIENELKNIPGNHTGLLQAHGLQGRLSQAIGEEGRTSDELRVQTYTKDNFRSGVVLSSDGMWRMARDFETVVSSAKSSADVVRRSINLANWVGGVDNASLITIEDTDRFCRSPIDSITAASSCLSITIWVSSAKIKILSYNWFNAPNATQSHPRSDKPKKRAAKERIARKNTNESQLRLESEIFNEARPKIEIIISETPKKDE